MSWVEDLTEDDEFTVEIRLPKEYVDYNIQGMKKYAAGISHLCKGAAILGDDETEFLVYDMTMMQVVSIEETMKLFGIEMTHECGKLPNGTRWVYFYADLRGLKEKMESGEIPYEGT